jgi:hypothetical protein
MIGGICSRHASVRIAYKILVKKLERGVFFEDPCIYRGIILKWML